MMNAKFLSKHDNMRNTNENYALKSLKNNEVKMHFIKTLSEREVENYKNDPKGTYSLTLIKHTTLIGE